MPGFLEEFELAEWFEGFGFAECTEWSERSEPGWLSGTEGLGTPALLRRDDPGGGG
jgi:hypothetical protein